jgi:hypothetical protein
LAIVALAGALDQAEAQDPLFQEEKRKKEEMS